MTKLEIIEETYQYYNQDVNRRAVVSSGCEYLTNDGRMCAVGRCLISPDKMPSVFSSVFSGNSTGIEALFEFHDLTDNIFKEQYRGHEIAFWEDLQDFHDKRENWNNEGITSIGIIHYQKLKAKYSN